MQDLSDLTDLAAALAGGSLDTRLEPLYGDRPGGVAAGRGRLEQLIGDFTNRFGPAGPAAIFSTPGRTEIGGNHTDHQNGCVLAGSVNLDIIAVARPNGLEEVRLESDGYPGSVISLKNLAPDPADFNDSRALVRGIVHRFRELGHAAGGFDVCMTSNVLKGSGLSSSAAFEVMVGTIVNHLFAGGEVGPLEIAIIGRYAENVFFGKPCGLMDQAACAMGGVSFIDFKDVDNPAVTKVSVDLREAGYALCIIDSGADHADLTGHYSAIPGEMGGVAAMFGKSVLRNVDKADFLRDIPAVRAKMGDRAVLRALHFYGDNDRVPRQADALAERNLPAFLAMVKESGASSHMYLQNIFPSGDGRHQEVGLVLALADEILAGRGAFRVHGGGFAGTVQAFMPLALLDEFRSRMEAVFGAGSCHVLSIRDVGTTRIA